MTRQKIIIYYLHLSSLKWLQRIQQFLSHQSIDRFFAKKADYSEASQVYL